MSYRSETTRQAIDEMYEALVSAMIVSMNATEPAGRYGMEIVGHIGRAITLLLPPGQHCSLEHAMQVADARIAAMDAEVTA